MDEELTLKLNQDEASALFDLLDRLQNQRLQRVRRCLLHYLSNSTPPGEESSNRTLIHQIRQSIDLADTSLKRSSSCILPEVKVNLKDNSNQGCTTRAIRSVENVKDLQAGLQKGHRIGICLSKCHHAGAKELIRSIIHCNSAQLAENPWSAMSSSSILWSDHTNQSLYSLLGPNQRINYLPQMHAIVTKSNLAKLLNLSRRIQSWAPFDYFPSTWQLPQDRIAVERALKSGTCTAIVKPSSGYQGRDIHITRRWDTIRQLADRIEPHGKSVVVQSYVSNPMLIDGLKWDMRVYVVIDSLSPLRAYLFQDGLARFATEPYTTMSTADATLNRNFMHLTNYSLNKMSRSYKHPVDDRDPSGSKRRISIALEQLRQHGHGIDNQGFWKQVSDIVGKTLIALWPSIWGSYQSMFGQQQPSDPCKCFQLLGFDILMDDKYKLWLLEVNSCPSLSTDTFVDVAIKQFVIKKTLEIVTGTALSCDQAPIDVIELIPERNPVLSEIFVFKTPFTTEHRHQMEQWRKELLYKEKRERDKADRTYEQSFDFSLPERFAMRKAMKQIASFEAETRTQIQNEMKKEMARLLNLGILEKSGPGSDHLTKYIPYLQADNLPTTDQFIENSDLSVWRLYLISIAERSSPMLCSNKFVRLLSTCHLTNKSGGFSRSDADLLFQQMIMTTAKHSTSIVHKSSSNKTGRIITFELFCEALLGIAARQFPDLNPIDAIRKLMIGSLGRVVISTVE